ncbi:MAG: ribonuclease PH, partial [Thiohalospira sp.]
TMHAAGSVLIEMGKTRVLCTAVIEDRVPRHCLDKNIGWVTSEYAMLPSAGDFRKSLRKQPGGRDMEISRLIGRALRAIVDLNALGRRTIWVDCNVIQADGGTRTASITGGYVALVAAMACEVAAGRLPASPVRHGIASVSVGVYQGTPVVDLDYAEDSTAETDMNVVMNDAGDYIEVQGTAEGHPFRRSEMEAMLDLAEGGIARLVAAQREALAQ